MTYKIKIYEKKKLKPSVCVVCSNDYLDGFKKDLFNSEEKFIDMEQIIVPKDNIKRVKVIKVSDN